MTTETTITTTSGTLKNFNSLLLYVSLESTTTPSETTTSVTTDTSTISKYIVLKKSFVMRVCYDIDS